jgi:hypothetical protein
MTMPGNRPKLMYVAAALSAGFHRDGVTPAANLKEAQGLMQQGQELQYYLDTAWRRTGGHQPSRAAHYKRQAKKRANIRARSKK